jgi:hypothetical protein
VILLVAFVHTLVFLLIVGQVAPSSCNNIGCLWVALLLSLPALAIHAAVGLTARLAPVGPAIGVAIVANLAVAAGGLVWLQLHPSRGQMLIDDAFYALTFFMIGVVAALLLIGYVRVVLRRPRGRDLS